MQWHNRVAFGNMAFSALIWINAIKISDPVIIACA
jgi:hypothetical protein